MYEYTNIIDGLRTPTRELSEAIPDAWAGFAKLHATAVADGALPARTKEPMALAIAVVKQFDGCIAFRPVRTALVCGARREHGAPMCSTGLGARRDERGTADLRLARPQNARTERTIECQSASADRHVWRLKQFARLTP